VGNLALAPASQPWHGESTTAPQTSGGLLADCQLHPLAIELRHNAHPRHVRVGTNATSGNVRFSAGYVGRLNREINAVIADPGITVRLAELGSTPLPGSPADYGKLIAEDTEKVIREANVRAE
jgi:hypothetical protein